MLLMMVVVAFVSMMIVAQESACGDHKRPVNEDK